MDREDKHVRKVCEDLVDDIKDALQDNHVENAIAFFVELVKLRNVFRRMIERNGAPIPITQGDKIIKKRLQYDVGDLKKRIGDVNPAIKEAMVLFKSKSITQLEIEGERFTA